MCVPKPFQDDPRQRRPDIGKARRVLKWEPRISIEEGLQRTIEDLREALGMRAS